MRIVKVAILWMALMLNGAVFANYYCDGGVYGVTLSPQGRLAVQSLGEMQWVYFCSVAPHADGSYWGDIPPDACKAMNSTVLTAQLTQRKVRVWFNDDVGGLTSDCTIDRHP